MDAPISSLIGRARERNEVLAALRDGQRLCSLVGPGGIGKTRLAHALCRDCGGLFVELSESRSLADALVRVASAIDLRSGATLDDGAPSIAHVARALAALEPSLLVLDNVEQIIDPIARALASWLASAPSLRVLVTSRERLALESERVFVLDALPLVSVDEATESDAVRLFLLRAEAAGARAIDREKARAIVAALEGVPLAIELAAARVRVLGVDALIERAGGLLDGLRAHRRDTPERHETLRRTVDWSWQLLTERDRAAFAASSVFAGGFDIDAANAVLAERAGEGAEVVQNLVDRSLVQARTDSLGRPRFYLFDALRQFASEQLDSNGQRGFVTARARAHFARRADALLAQYERRANDRSLSELEIDRDNLWATGSDLDHPAEAQRALVALDPVARMRGAIASHEQALLAAIDARPPDAALAARAWRTLARFALHRAANSLAEERYVRALSLLDAHAASPLQVELRIELGVLAHQQRLLPQAEARYLDALALATTMNAPALLARAQANLAAVHHDRGAFFEAERAYRTALSALASLDEPRLEGITRSNLALLALERGALDEAEPLFDRARVNLEASGDRRLLAINDANYGLLLHCAQRLRAARDHHERAVAALAGLGETRSEGLARARLGGALAALGEHDRARRELVLSESLLERADDRHGLDALALYRSLLALYEPDAESLASATSAAAALVARVTSADRALSDDVRIAARIVEQRARALTHSPAPVAPSQEGRPTLVVGPDCEWFRVQDSREQDLRRYGPLRRIFAALVTGHRAEGQWLTIDDLLSAGWPGERVLHEAAMNRVHVSLSDLRRRGLKPWLVQRDARYRLARELVILQASDALAPPALDAVRPRKRSARD